MAPSNPTRITSPAKPSPNFSEKQLASLAPQPGDSHASSGYVRVVVDAIEGEFDKLVQAYRLAPLDDLDEQEFRRGMAPLVKTIKHLWGRVDWPCMDEVRRIRIGVREYNARRRLPTHSEFAAIVDEACGIDRTPVSSSDAQARRHVQAPTVQSVMGIPGTTVKAAYQDVTMPKGHDITLADVPTHDNEGNLIGEGRREFLRCMHRMKGGHSPVEVMG